MAQIRFRELVSKSGRPEMVTLWSDPKRDSHFMKAVKQNRVMTVVQEPRSKKKDFAEIGFHQLPHASYLVFPKPLPADRKSRVIGIQYDLIEQPPPKDPVPKDKLEAGRHQAKTKARVEPKSTTRKFTVLMRRVATIETSLDLSARDEADAREQAMTRVKRERFDLTKAVMKNEIVAVDNSPRSEG